jgi:hypothetical protein
MLIENFTTTSFEIENVIFQSQQLKLEQNYPNPFNPTTTIEYSIPNLASSFGFSNITLKVYDILGNEIVVLVNEPKLTGKYSVSFNADNFSSGIYYYKLTSGDYSEVKKMIILK